MTLQTHCGDCNEVFQSQRKTNAVLKEQTRNEAEFTTQGRRAYRGKTNTVPTPRRNEYCYKVLQAQKCN